jgi:hypothetical protein
MVNEVERLLCLECRGLKWTHEPSVIMAYRVKTDGDNLRDNMFDIIMKEQI